MKAVFETGGKQYFVTENDVIFVEKLEAAEGESVVFDKVLLVDDQVGTPYVKGATVTAKVLKQGRGPKIAVFKFKRRKNYRKKQGHRQAFTKLQIEAISGK